MKKQFILIKNFKEIDSNKLINFLNYMQNQNNFYSFFLNENFIFNIVLYYKNQFNNLYITFIPLTKKTLNEIITTSSQNFLFIDYKSENNFIEFKKFIEINKNKLIGKYLIILKYKIKNGELINKENKIFSSNTNQISLNNLAINLSEINFFFTKDINIILKKISHFLIYFFENYQKKQSIIQNFNEYQISNINNKKLLKLLDIKEINLNLKFKSTLKEEKNNYTKNFSEKLFKNLFNYLKTANQLKKSK